MSGTDKSNRRFLRDCCFDLQGISTSLFLEYVYPEEGGKKFPMNVCNYQQTDMM